VLKLLVLSDIHNQDITLKAILQALEKIGSNPDICLIAGDITNFGTTKDLEDILNVVVNRIPNTFYVIGNCDPIIDSSNLETSAIDVEAKHHKMGPYSIIGFGTHKPKLDQKKLKKLSRANEQVCLLTHAPPFKTSADMVYPNRHVGSKQLREFIEKNKHVFLSISGHIHDSPSISKLNNCTIVNPGPVTTGNFAIIEIHKDLKIKGKIYNLHEL